MSIVWNSNNGMVSVELNALKEDQTVDMIFPEMIKSGNHNGIDGNAVRNVFLQAGSKQSYYFSLEHYRY